MQICSKSDLHKLNALYELKDSCESKSLDLLMQTVLNVPTFKYISARSKREFQLWNER